MDQALRKPVEPVTLINQACEISATTAVLNGLITFSWNSFVEATVSILRFFLWFQRQLYAFQLLIVSELFRLLSWNFLNVLNWRYFGYLFWITARDIAAKPFLSLWSIKHKMFVADNISSRNVIWITVKEIDKFDR